MGIRLVTIRPEHVKALERLQIDCFPTLAPHERMREQHFLSHCRVFPEGDFVALEGERVIGLGSGFFTDFDFRHPHHTFQEMIAGGFYTNHDPEGAWYYGGDISVHPDYRGKLTVPEYVDKVVAGELVDPTLNFQLKNGFRVRGLLENYLEDEVSDGWAALIVWENPDHRAF